MKKILFLFVLLFMFSISATYVGYQHIAVKLQIYNTNVIGITGISSAQPYIEIVYSEAYQTGKNITRRIMVSPPYLFECGKVIIQYDSVLHTIGGACSREQPAGYDLLLNHQYDEGGAEYFRIINHSADKPIEFFIAGAQKVVKSPTGGPMEFAEVLPIVSYRKAPVYYLLFPERKYPYNVTLNSFTFEDNVYFEGNRCGDIELNSAWQIEDVMKLYRAEYKCSFDTILYAGNYGLGQRMSNEKGVFYGKILPQEQLKGEDIWLLATPDMFKNYLVVNKKF